MSTRRKRQAVTPLATEESTASQLPEPQPEEDDSAGEAQQDAQEEYLDDNASDNNETADSEDSGASNSTPPSRVSAARGRTFKAGRPAVGLRDCAVDGCKRTDMTPMQLANHMASCHFDKMLYSCYLCHRGFTGSASLDAHYKESNTHKLRSEAFANRKAKRAHYKRYYSGKKK